MLILILLLEGNYLHLHILHNMREENSKIIHSSHKHKKQLCTYSSIFTYTCGRHKKTYRLHTFTEMIMFMFRQMQNKSSVKKYYLYIHIILADNSFLIILKIIISENITITNSWENCKEISLELLKIN